MRFRKIPLERQGTNIWKNLYNTIDIEKSVVLIWSRRHRQLVRASVVGKEMVGSWRGQEQLLNGGLAF